MSLYCLGKHGPQKLGLFSHAVCMYVCMRIYVRAEAYSLNCYIGAMVSRRTFQSLVVHRTASETSMGREVSVAMSFTDRVGPECEKLRCP